MTEHTEEDETMNVDDMNLEQLLMYIATLIREGKKEEADKVITENLNQVIYTIVYDLRDEGGRYPDGHISIVLLKTAYYNEFVTSEDCYFLYKRSVDNTMTLVGAIDLTDGTVVFVEEFLSEETKVPKSITLCYPEFYIARRRKMVNPSDAYHYTDENYEEVATGWLVNRREIFVQGEGKNNYTIGFTPEKKDDKRVYLYDTYY